MRPRPTTTHGSRTRTNYLLQRWHKDNAIMAFESTDADTAIGVPAYIQQGTDRQGCIALLILSRINTTVSRLLALELMAFGPGGGEKAKTIGWPRAYRFLLFVRHCLRTNWTASFRVTFRFSLKFHSSPTG